MTSSDGHHRCVGLSHYSASWTTHRDGVTALCSGGDRIVRVLKVVMVVMIVEVGLMVIPAA